MKSRCWLLGIFLLSPSAHGLLEARLSYGLLATSTNLDPLCATCTEEVPKIVPTYGLGADAILTLPFPFVPGFGLRYENMALTAKKNNLTFKTDYTRTAILINWRPLDRVVYIGPILTYGLSHSTSLTAEENGITKADFSADSATSYSVGLEGGVKLIGFTLGGELGYLNFQWKNAKDATANAPTQGVNMSGPYAKFILGFSI